MSRYLAVTCTSQRCKETGQAQIHGTTARDLPPSWLVVSHSYDSPAMEFCSLACLEKWCAAMQKAHQSHREWRERKAP